MLKKPLGEIATLLNAELHGDPSLLIHGIAEPLQAQPGQIALLTDPQRLAERCASRASAFVVKKILADFPKPQMICSDVSRTLGMLLNIFTPPAALTPCGIDTRAVVDQKAQIHRSAWIGPYVVVGPEVRIGENTRVDPFTYIGAYSRVGKGCHIHPGCTLAENTHIDDNVVIGPGAVIGYRGFGFWRDREGFHPILAQGKVKIEADVEIGANTCIDRASLGETKIGQGVKCDNLVQIGHNVQIGARSLLCAQVGLAGSVSVGNDSILAGQVGVADHVKIGHQSRIGAKSGVAKDVRSKEDVSGYPAIGHRQWLRSAILFSQLGELWTSVRHCKRQLAQLLEDVQNIKRHLF